MSALWAAFLVTALGSENAMSELVEDFEGAQTTWSIAGSDCRVHVEIHRRTARHARRGSRCEHVRIRAESGTHVYATHPIRPAIVIEELRPTLWVRSDRVGLQLMARVVLPRSKDPRSGRPLTTLIRGSSYEHAGSWQRLQIRDPQLLLERRVRVLRAQFGAQIDHREAFIDLIVLNIYGGLGVTNTWIDDLEVENHVAGLEDVASSGGDSIHQGVGQSAAARSGSLPQDESQRVQLRRSTLLVDGQPFSPRVIEHQGEPFSWLARLGFNTVKLRGPPTEAQTEEAAQLGLWIIAPATDQDAVPDGGRQILAWDLGRGLSHQHLDSVKARAALLRRESDQSRPLICSADTGLYSYSRHADILLHERLPLGTSFELAEFPRWLVQRSRLARPGTPFWVSVQTEPNPHVVKHLMTYDPAGPSLLYVDPEQPRIMALLAVTAGARGIWFRSQSPLDGKTHQARIRALTLQRVNHELSLIEPWIAGGGTWTYVDSSSSEVVAAALATPRSRLIVPIRVSPGLQYVAGDSDGKPVALTVPGAHESSRAFQLVTSSLEPLRYRQVAGGMRVVLEKLSPAGIVVLTQDPLVMQSLSRRAAAAAERQMRIRRDLAAAVLSAVEATEQRLRSVGPAEPRVDAFLTQSRASLRQCGRFLAARDHSTADRYATNCLAALRGLRRLRWEQAVLRLPSPVASPLAVHYATLPWHWQIYGQTGDPTGSPNILPAGDFESLDRMLETGWRHYQHAPPDTLTDVSLTPYSPRAGRFALQLRAKGRASRKPDSADKTTAVWVNSAPVRVEAGQQVRIHGWVRVDKPIVGSFDGLMVFDSVGGPLLAQRVRRTESWQEIALYRQVAEPTELMVTFALTGLGTVSIDDFSVDLLRGARWTGPSPGGLNKR